MLLNADFPISNEIESQRYPAVGCAQDQYCAFWTDHRFYSIDSSSCLYCSRVSTDGSVIDPNGKLLYYDDAAYEMDVAFDGTNYLVIFRNHC